MSKIYALWHGGANYGPSSVPDDVESFPSLSAAKRALSDRAEVGGWRRQTFDYVNRESETVFTPNADAGGHDGHGPELEVFFADPSDSDDPYPDRVLSIGPRGGIRSENV